MTVPRHRAAAPSVHARGVRRAHGLRGMQPVAAAATRSAVATAAALAALAAAGSARAQSTDAAPVEVITVTSQRREQELQKVPLPISTFRASDLESRTITDTLKVASFVPNMYASNNTGLGTANVYYIRGLGNTESIATFDPPVGTYIDDIYVSRQNANNFGFFDVERIEVLRGPQGTLFGRNTTGGAMRLILKRPSFTAGGYFGTGLGSYNEISARGSYDMPLSDKLATKVSFFAKRDSGYVSNTTTGDKINEAETYGARFATRWRVSTDLNWDLAAEYMQDNGANVYNAAVGGIRVARTGLREVSPGFFGPTGAPVLKNEKNGYGLGNNVRSKAITSNVRLSLSDTLSLEFVTGWRDMTQKFALDFGNTPVASGGFTIANDGRHKQISQEIKAVGEAGALTYVAGVFYMREDNRTDLGDVFNTAFSGAPAPGTTLALGDRIVGNDTTSAAVYAQGDYKLGAFTLTLGARYTREKKTVEFTELRSGIAAASQLTSANMAALGIPLELNTNVTTPRAALAWQLSPATMLFTSATRGFKSGGWNARATAPVNMQPFAPEFIWSYEAGWRTAFMGNRVRFNGTAFKSTTKQLQTPSAFVAPSGAVSFITRNFADLGNQGLELDLNASLTPDLTAYLAFGYQDAKYENVAASILSQAAACKASIAAGATARPNCLNGIVDVNGNIAPPVRVPKQSINLGATYSFGVGGGFKLANSAHASYASRTSVGTAANAFAAGHTTINAAISLVAPSDQWRVTLDCSNCSNKVYITSFLANLNYLPDPRRYTLKLNVKL
jgi:iron complex outermembrane recepter protein